MKAKPDKRFVISSLFRLNCSTIKLVLCFLVSVLNLIKFGRLVLLLHVIGQVRVCLQSQDLDEVGYFRRLKSAVGHDYVNENEVYQSPLLKIKFTFRKDLNRQQIYCCQNWPKRRYWTRLGWPWDGAWRSGRSCSSGLRCGDTRNRTTWNPCY